MNIFKKALAFLLAFSLILLIEPLEPLYAVGTNQIAITIDDKYIDEDLYGFPVDVFVSSGILDSSNHTFSQLSTPTDKSNVYFTDHNGDQLPFEVDYFNSTSLRAHYIVKSDLTKNDHTVIYMNFGGTDDYSAGYLATEVWEHYNSVLDFNDLQSKGKDTLYTSSNGGVAFEAKEYSNVATFDGINDYVTLGYNILKEPSEDDYTYTLYFKTTDTKSVILDSHKQVFAAERFTPQVVVNASGMMQVSNKVNTIESSYITSSGTYNDGSYHQLTVVSKTSDTLNEDTLTLYIDGVNVIRNSGMQFVAEDFIYNYYILGAGFGSTEWNTDNSMNYTAMSIDDFRLTNGVHSDAWIKAEYYSLIGTLSKVNTTVITGSDAISVFDGSGTTVVIDSGINIKSTEEITDATIQITNGVAGDMLYGSGSYDTGTYVMTVSGVSTVELLEKINNIRYGVTDSSVAANTHDLREITISIGNALFKEINFQDHYYQNYRYVTSGLDPLPTNSGVEPTWDAAYYASNSSTFLGLQGYLVTITSEQENTFINDKIQSHTWISLSDQATEGDWRIMSGPEAGTLVGVQSGVTSSGNYEFTLEEGQYANWDDVICVWTPSTPYCPEPNGDENINWAELYYGYTTWNDAAQTTGVPHGFVVEYGGMLSDPPVILTLKKSIVVADNVIDITYDYNDNVRPDYTFQYSSGVNFIPPVLSRNNYEFNGWYADANFDTSFTSGILSTDSTFYAQWKPKLVFITNSESRIEDIVAVTAYTITVPSDPVKPDYTFDGWYLDSSFTQPSTIPTTMPSISKTYYAKWKSNVTPTSYDITRLPLVETHHLDLSAYDLTIPLHAEVQLPEFAAYKLYGYFKTDVTDQVVINGSFDSEVLGDYSITYSLTIENIHEGKTDHIIKTFYLHVIDEIPPVLIGEESITILKDSEYKSSVYCQDNYDETCVVQALDTLDSSILGSQNLHFYAIDSSDNVSHFTQKVEVRLPISTYIEVDVNDETFVFPLLESEFDLENYTISYLIATEMPNVSDSGWQLYDETTYPLLEGESVYIKVMDQNGVTYLKSSLPGRSTLTSNETSDLVDQVEDDVLDVTESDGISLWWLWLLLAVILTTGARRYYVKRKMMKKS